jgi:DNA-binding transcriptional MocR family regulator
MSQPQVSQLHTPPELIDFGIGQPGFDMLPLEEIRQAADRSLSHGNAASLNYGFEQGDENLRTCLAFFLSQQYQIPVDLQELFITNGVSIALDILCTLYTKPGDTIFVEEPTYYLALKIFSDHQLNIVSVATDEYGLVDADLREKLTYHQPVFLYTVPVFQNPTGNTLSSSRREIIVRMAQRHGFLIIADEVYQLLAYTTDPPLPFASFLDSGKVIALGSFSKILAPGLRLGWLHAPPPVMDRLTSCGLLESGGGLNPFTSSIVSGFIESGWLSKNIIRLREEFQHRKNSLVNELSEQLGSAVSFTEPDGGYFLWLAFAESIDMNELRNQAENYNISWLPGRVFAPSDRYINYGRFCFAHYGSETLVEGVSRLAALVHDYSDTTLK